MLIKNAEELSITPDRKFALDILEKSLLNLNPSRVIERIAKDLPSPGKDSFFYVYGIGKASQSLYAGIRNALSERIKKGIIIIPDDEEQGIDFPELLILRGTHPYPSELSVESTKKLLSDLEKRYKEDLVIFLVSGGGSALFEIPENGLTVQDISSITECVMDHGADITELNAIRILLSRVKGGKTLDHIGSDNVSAFYVSDVIGNDIRFIASGPLVRSDFNPDKVVEKFRFCMKKGFVPPQSHGDKTYKKIQNRIILSNRDFVNFIRHEIGEERCIDLGTEISGNVDQAAERILGTLRNLQGRIKETWFAGAGETTVTLKGNGRGGRNQELCLHVLEKLHEDEDILFISAGTDGIDGASPAMGGIVDRKTLESTSTDEIRSVIDNNDSYTFLSKHRGSIMTGRTGNNVSDIMFGRYEVISS